MTIIKTAFGLYSTRGMMMHLMISAFRCMSSKRDSLLLCRAPTVIITTRELLVMQKSANMFMYLHVLDSNLVVMDYKFFSRSQKNLLIERNNNINIAFLCFPETPSKNLIINAWHVQVAIVQFSLYYFVFLFETD